MEWPSILRGSHCLLHSSHLIQREVFDLLLKVSFFVSLSHWKLSGLETIRVTVIRKSVTAYLSDALFCMKCNAQAESIQSFIDCFLEQAYFYTTGCRNLISTSRLSRVNTLKGLVTLVLDHWNITNLMMKWISVELAIKEVWLEDSFLNKTFGSFIMTCIFDGIYDRMLTYCISSIM